MATQQPLLQMDTSTSQNELQTCFIGIGGTGGNIISYLHSKMITENHYSNIRKNLDFVAINTDNQDLSKVTVNNTICIGTNICSGYGAGQDPECGKQSAIEDRQRVLEYMKNHEFSIVVAGLGGGTGTGATPEVCRMIIEDDLKTCEETGRRSNRLIIVIYVYPFTGSRQQRIYANNCIKETSDILNGYGGIFLVSNEKFVRYKDAGPAFSDTFDSVNTELDQLIQAMMETLYIPGTMNADFRDFGNVVRKGVILNMSYGVGKTREVDSNKIIQSAVKNIFFSSEIFSHSNSALLYFFGKYFGGHSINELLGNNEIMQQANCANIIYGINENFDNMKFFMLTSSEYSDDLITEWVRESDEFPTKKEEVPVIAEQLAKETANGLPKQIIPAGAERGNISFEAQIPTPPESKQMGLFSISEDMLDDDTVPSLMRLKGQIRYPKN